jgi:histone-lysine N-methyltransferase SETMAR
MKMSVTEQRTNIKFCVLLKKSPSETLRMLEKAYGKAAMKKTQVYKWHKRFRDGRASVNDDPRSGRPSTSTNDNNIERVRNVVRSDWRKSIQEISSEIGISVGSVHSILRKNLNIPRKPPRKRREH